MGLLPVRLKPVLMPVPTMATMDMDMVVTVMLWDMPTMDMDTDIMARGPLMPSQLPLLSLLLMLTTDMVVMDTWDMPTMDTDMPPGMDMDMDMVMDTDMPTMDTTARGPLMLSPLLSLLLMLITDTELMVMDTDMDMDMDMPTTGMPDILMLTVPMDMDMVVKFFVARF